MEIGTLISINLIISNVIILFHLECHMYSRQSQVCIKGGFGQEWQPASKTANQRRGYRVAAYLSLITLLETDKTDTGIEGLVPLKPSN